MLISPIGRRGCMASVVPVGVWSLAHRSLVVSIGVGDVVDLAVTLVSTLC